MRKILVLMAGLMMAATVTAPPAAAITGDFVEDFEHPYVGLVALYDEDGAYLQRCSGTLLSSTVFLTAGHCTSEETGAASARVYFQQDAGANYDPALDLDPVSGYPEYCAEGTEDVCATSSGELHNLGWSRSAALPDSGDAGLVILEEPIRLEEYGALAAAGTLDALSTRRGQQDLTFTVSGYGLSDSNAVSSVSYRERLMAESRLTNLRSHITDGYNLQTNGNGSGRGGTCSGDSGGPVFQGGFESNLVVAITSFGQNPYCGGADFGYRTDRQEVLDWIRATVGEDLWAEIEVIG
ncbi:trypsin-like serine protease [Nocardioides sediminis]|uniref:trypsin-like serine protease n=1 Tax=Nocardioides sediminis TaxID=433648 RepID=UPI000D303793|nr:trypsin-like serine protease [Nocardioides sediminis]